MQQNLIPELPLDNWTDNFVDYVQDINVVDEFFDLVKDGIGGFVGALEGALTAPPVLLMVFVFAAIAFFLSGWRVALFSVLGFLLIVSLGLWEETMLSLAFVLASTVVSFLIGVPIGVLASRSRPIEAASTPTLAIM